MISERLLLSYFKILKGLKHFRLNKKILSNFSKTPKLSFNKFVEGNFWKLY